MDFASRMKQVKEGNPNLYRLSPDDLTITESDFKNIDNYKGNPSRPISAVQTGGKLNILDGHHRTKVAQRDGTDINAVFIPESEYLKMKADGIHPADMQREYVVRGMPNREDAIKKDSSNLLASAGAGIGAATTLPWMAKRAEAAEQERISAQIDGAIANMSRGQTIEAPINPYYQTAADALGRYNQALSGSPAEYLLGAEDLENYFRKGAYGEAGLGDAAMGALNIGEAFVAPLEGIRYLGKITNK
jgi:hypothetical protein